MAVRGVGEQRTIEPVGVTKENPAQGTRTTQQTNNEPIPAAVNNLPNIQTDLKRFELNQRFDQTAATQTPPNHIGSLSQGDSVAIPIGETTTQTDVLRAAYTEFGTRAGLNDPAAFSARMVNDGDQLFNPVTNTTLSAEEFENARRNGSISVAPQAAQLTAARQARVEELTSYSLFDWSVTADEQRQAVGILQNDPNLSDTIGRLESNGSLGNLINRVDDNAARRDLIDTLGRNLNPQTAEIVRPHIENLDVRDTVVSAHGNSFQSTDVSSNLWQVRFNMARLGITPTNTGFDTSRYADLIGANNGAFSGVGATGVNPTTVDVPLSAQWGLLTGNEETRRTYSNPIPGSLPDYINSVSPEDRARQAELLLRRPVSTTMPEVLGNDLPSRADVIRAAANRYNLQPEVVAAFILAEQRDQSQNEDGKDYTAATSIRQANTSIGLGQVVISTAQRNNLFSDLISERTQAGMRHNQVATLLADDTANIFAAARYLRQVADDGSRRSIADLPRTQAKFPNINMSAYGQNSSQWTDDNIRALGSEYTSTAWDDRLSPGWGDFVLEAYRDVQRSGVFGR